MKVSESTCKKDCVPTNFSFVHGGGATELWSDVKGKGNHSVKRERDRGFEDANVRLCTGIYPLGIIRRVNP